MLTLPMYNFWKPFQYQELYILNISSVFRSDATELRMCVGDWENHLFGLSKGHWLPSYFWEISHSKAISSCITVLDESRSVFVCFFPARSRYKTDGHQHNLAICSPNCGTSFLFRNFWEPSWILNSISFNLKNMGKMICFSKMLLSTLFLQLTWAIRKSLENLSFSWQNQCLIVHLQVKSNSSFWVKKVQSRRKFSVHRHGPLVYIDFRDNFYITLLEEYNI